MRVTNNLLIHNMLWNMNNNLSTMNTQQNQLSTGKRILKASDDPVGTTKVIKLKSDIVENEQYKENTRDARAWMEVSENSLTDVKDILQRIRELAVQGANGVYTEAETAKIASEVEQLKEEIIVNSNSTIAGRYLFSGFHTDEKLLNDDGTFNIDITSKMATDPELMTYEVTIGEELEVQTDLVKTFGYVDVNNLISNNFPVGEDTGDAATHSKLKGAFSLTSDLTAGGSNPIRFTVDTITYEMDTTDLVGSAQSPIPQELLTERILGASKVLPAPADANVQLGSVADVYYDHDGELVIEANAFGPTVLSVSDPGGEYAETATAGLAATQAVVNGTELITDDDVNDATGIQSFVVTFGDETHRIDVDMSSETTTAGLVLELNSQLDHRFGAGNVVASETVVNVGPPQEVTIGFTAAAVDDGSRSELAVDVIKADKSKLIDDLDQFVEALNDGNQGQIEAFLGKVDVHIDNILVATAEIGAKNNRIDFIDNRIDDNEIAYTSLLSQVYDIDYSETIIKFKSLESIYRASLSVGAKVIQPTLVDFIQ